MMSSHLDNKGLRQLHFHQSHSADNSGIEKSMLINSETCGELLLPNSINQLVPQRANPKSYIINDEESLDMSALRGMEGDLQRGGVEKLSNGQQSLHPKLIYDNQSLVTQNITKTPTFLQIDSVNNIYEKLRQVDSNFIDLDSENSMMRLDAKYQS